jgi:hypothetical protein
LLGGIVLILVGVGLAWFFSSESSGKTRIVVPTSLLLVGLVLTVAGICGLVSGQKIFEWGAGWEISLGPPGVSRTPTNPSAMIDGWVIPWDQIDHLEYQEGFPEGNQTAGKTLVIHTVSGNRERVGVAEEVSREQLADAALVWGKGLEVTQAGTWTAAS